MKPQIEDLVREVQNTRAELRSRKAVLRNEANPAVRFKRSWNRHRWVWMGAGALAVTTLVLLLKGRKSPPPRVPPGYVVVAPAPRGSGWFGMALKILPLVAKPLASFWMKRFQPGQKAPPRY